VVKNRITFIKGPPGCGKTTVLSRICRIFGENNKKVLVGAVSKSANLALTRKLVNETSFFKS
jgi:ABC-type cobalamin/Fe3+-siderophores transport system ATPase subunit